jgi:hypothetical protein
MPLSYWLMLSDIRAADLLVARGIQGEAKFAGSAGDVIDFCVESLQRGEAIFHDVAGIEPTEEGVRTFLQRHPELGTEPEDLITPLVLPGTVLQTHGPRPPATPNEWAVFNTVILCQCVRLWELVQRNDQVRLAHYIKPHPNEDSWFIYSSHPDLPADQYPLPYDFQIWLIQAHAGPDRKAKTESQDLRPLVLECLRRLINLMLEHRVNARVCERRGSEGRMELAVVPQTRLAALWLQFAQEVTGKIPPSRCPVCQEPFRPTKHRDRMYCSSGKCKVTAHRIRKRAERQLADGVSFEEVAKQENLDESVLRNLLETWRKKDSDRKEKDGAQ